MDLLSPYRKVAAFLLPYFAVVTLFALIVCVADKPALHLKLRSVHGEIGDLFFRGCSLAGGLVAVAAVLAVFLVLRRWKTSAALALAFAVSSFVTQGLKYLIKVPRPWFYFETLQNENAAYSATQLWVPKGVALSEKISPSFPSGHATTAFVLFLCLAFFAGRSRINQSLSRLAQFACLGAASLAAYSRVYLSFHFAEDVLVGSVIGVLVVCAAFPFVDYLCERFQLNPGNDNLYEDD